MGDYLARDFHKRGFRVFATARNLKKVEHLKALGMEVLALEVTSEESINAAVKDVKTITGGTLDFLVNNSGSGRLPFHPAHFFQTNTDNHGVRIFHASIRC